MRLGRWVEPEVAATEDVPVEARGLESGAGGNSAVAALHLPVAVLKFPESLQKAAQSMLPCGDLHVPEAKVWAPVLGWIAMRGLPSANAALVLYDELQLRHALAETFSGVGVKGEDAWKAAAQIRVLLRVGVEASLLEAIATEGFWNDPDVRWLTGAHANEEGVEYFAKEPFEAFVCWLQLPGLIAGVEDAALPTKTANDVTAISANLAYAAKIAGYRVKPFVEQLIKGELVEAKLEEEPVVVAVKRKGKTTKV
jgi:hypothetical protein